METTETRLGRLIEHSKQAVRRWWLLLLAGLILFVLGIIVFLFPAQSYVGLAILFGWGILAAGVLEVMLSTSNRHYVTGRGWMLAGGIIEILLGILLISNKALSASTLPIFLGFWLLIRSFGAIGLSGDMHTLGIPGSGWTLTWGILLLLCSIWILMQPLVFGSAVVIAWVGISLLFAAGATVSVALQLRQAHRCMK